MTAIDTPELGAPRKRDFSPKSITSPISAEELMLEEIESIEEPISVADLEPVEAPPKIRSIESPISVADLEPVQDPPKFRSITEPISVADLEPAEGFDAFGPTDPAAPLPPLTVAPAPAPVVPPPPTAAPEPDEAERVRRTEDLRQRQEKVYQRFAKYEKMLEGAGVDPREKQDVFETLKGMAGLPTERTGALPSAEEMARQPGTVIDPGAIFGKPGALGEYPIGGTIGTTLAEYEKGVGRFSLGKQETIAGFQMMMGFDDAGRRRFDDAQHLRRFYVPGPHADGRLLAVGDDGRPRLQLRRRLRRPAGQHRPERGGVPRCRVTRGLCERRDHLGDE